MKIKKIVILTSILLSLNTMANYVSIIDGENISYKKAEESEDEELDLSDELKLQASDKQAGDNFGVSVSINGDMAIVGAYGDDTGGSDSGAAYIYQHDGSTWIEKAKLKASDKQASDSFGMSVSIDGNIAIVGAYNEDSGGSNAGAAYIYQNNGSAWVEQVKLQASDKAAGDSFGYAVSISGDKVIVGARFKDTGGADSGAAYIYQNNGSAWVEQVKLQASDKAAGDWFGNAVSISGNTVIVGSNGEDTGGSNAGAAYIYQNNGSAWVEQVKLQASDKQASDNFGVSVSISGNTAIVGASYEDTGGSNAGAAYVYQNNGSTWSEQVKLQASNTIAGDSFGGSVSTDGNTLIVGAYGEDTGGSSAGAAYAYQFDGSVWTEKEKLQASDKESVDLFGKSVSIHNGKALVGSYREDTGGSDAGAAYVFD